MGMLSKLQKLANSPQGKKYVKQAQDYAKSPEGKQKLERAREFVAKRGDKGVKRKRLG